jgi:hypothetical protein
MSVIVPAHLELYLWTTTQTRESIRLSFKLPPKLSASDFSISISDSDPRAIHCSLSSELPFLAGILFSSASKAELSVSKDSATLVISKSEPGEWGQLIVGPIPDSCVIDPSSAFQLALYLFAGATQGGVPRAEAVRMAKNARFYLGVAVAANLPPALLFQASQILRGGGEESIARGEEMLDRAVNRYEYSKAAPMLGMIYVKSQRFREAVEFFEAKAVQGDDACANCLGELYSPIEGLGNGLEDEHKAVEVFQGILARNPAHPFALSNMARMYLEGCGVRKDVRRATELYGKARTLDTRIPVIQQCEGQPVERPSFGFWLGLSVPVLVGGVMLGMKILRSRRR